MAELGADEIAERLQRRSRRILWVSGLLFLVWQAGYFVVFPDTGETLRNVDKVRTLAFLAWAAALLLLLATGGGWRRSQAVQEIVDDESTRAHRAAGFKAGFWVMTLLTFALYAAAQFEDVRASDALHVVLSGGVLAAVLRFVVLERRAADG